MSKETLPKVIHKQRSFRPWPSCQFILERADAIGLNVSELLNEIVTKHAKRHVELKTAAMHRAATMKPATRHTKPSPKSRH